MNTNLEELERKAKAATPGPWWPLLNTAGQWEVNTYRDNGSANDVGDRYGANICCGIGDHTEKRTSSDEALAHFIAALDPATVLELIRLARIGEAQRWIAWPQYEHDIGEPGFGFPDTHDPNYYSGKKYLTCDASGGRAAQSYYGEGEDVKWERVGGYFDQFRQITHWLPLPDAPKEQP